MTIRYWGKKMLREWWKDEENRQHVEWLKAQLFEKDASVSGRKLRAVGLPEELLQESVGRLLQRFLGELGVTVVPLAAAVEGAASAAVGAAAAARQTVDCLITPMVKRAAQEREEFYNRLTSVSTTLQAQLDKLPRVSFPVIDGQGPVFEPFAKIGLLFTRNLDRIREAYNSAGAAEGLWDPA